jgi:hypothetical protein
MPSLRRMIDGDGSLQLNVPHIPVDTNWRAQDDFVLRRKVNRTGPNTSEVLVGKILAMRDDGTAEVSINKQGGITQRAIVSLQDISPVTETFRRSSIQFSPQYRPRA